VAIFKKIVFLVEAPPPEVRRTFVELYEDIVTCFLCSGTHDATLWKIK
jgi:hypothetical protein